MTECNTENVSTECNSEKKMETMMPKVSLQYKNIIKL